MMLDIMDIRFMNVKAAFYGRDEKPLERAEMAEVVYWLGWFGRPKREPQAAQPTKPKMWARIDPALKVLLDRGDDRLLSDVGLTRETALGETGHYWYERSRRRDPWNL
ncbi:MAG: hypothetical protein ACFCUW_09250 [Kiloniellaceae bacterium]